MNYLKKALRSSSLARKIISLYRLAWKTPYFRSQFFDSTFQKKMSVTPRNLDQILNRFEPLLSLGLNSQGCIVECGIGYGRSLQIITSLLCLKDPSRKVLGFDSFEGFPELTEEDNGGKTHKSRGLWKYVMPHHIEEIISESKNGDNPVNTELFKGFFEDTLNQEVLDKIRSYGGIAFLHLDVDLYESYMCTLTRLWDSVNPGGVVLFDEYHPSSRVKYPGAYKAINKFLFSRDLDPSTHVKTDKTGKCYVIKPDAQS